MNIAVIMQPIVHTQYLVSRSFHDFNPNSYKKIDIIVMNYLRTQIILNKNPVKMLLKTL